MSVLMTEIDKKNELRAGGVREGRREKGNEQGKRLIDKERLGRERGGYQMYMVGEREATWSPAWALLIVKKLRSLLLRTNSSSLCFRLKCFQHHTICSLSATRSWCF